MRIVIELSRDGQAAQVLNALYKHTAMQTAFAVNMLALVDREPRTIRLKKVLEHYIDFRREVIRRRSEFDLEKARERAHILEGLLKALDQLDEVIRTIRASHSADAGAGTNLQEAPFDLTSARRRPSSTCSSAAWPPSSARRSRTSTSELIAADQLPRGPARQPAQDRLPDQGRARPS